MQYILFKKELQIDGFTKMYGFLYFFIPTNLHVVQI